MVRLICFSMVLTALLGSASASAAPTAVNAANPSLLVLRLPAMEVTSAVPVASNWTYSGCWSPRTGSPCVDVYRDTQGRPWICKACRTTGNPGPGKCRQTTQAELDRGLWCS
jgi:hypothetical protein